MLACNNYYEAEKDGSPCHAGQPDWKTEEGSAKWNKEIKLEVQNGNGEVNFKNGKTKWKLERRHLSATVDTWIATYH